MVEIEGIQTDMLVDSGSEVTAISEEFAENNFEIFKNCAKLPITGKKVRVAIGNKTTNIKWQIICKLKIDESVEHMIFVIVPGLARNCILGYDGQKDLKIAIFPETDSMTYKNKVIAFESVQCDSTISHMSVCKGIVDCTQLCCVCDNHTIKIDDISDTIEEIRQINLLEYNDNDQNIIFEGNNHNNIFNDIITKEKIGKKVSSNTMLQQGQKKQLVDLIFKYKRIFDKNTGLIKNLEYELRPKDDSPLFIKTYPKPLENRKVNAEIQNLLDLGLICRLNNNFVDPVVSVLKKDGLSHVCLEDKQFLMGIEEIFRTYPEARHMSFMDFAARFWHIKLANGSRKCVIFATLSQIYHFNVNPSCCENSTAALLRAFSIYYFDFNSKLVGDPPYVIYAFKGYKKILRRLTLFFGKKHMKLNLEKVHCDEQKDSNIQGISESSNKAELQIPSKSLNLDTGYMQKAIARGIEQNTAHCMRDILLINHKKRKK